MKLNNNFNLRDRVVIKNTTDVNLDGHCGTILGTSIHKIPGQVDFYIVLLDNPLPTHLAIQIIETCLELSNE